MKKSKLLMIYDKRSTFVGRDVEILAQNYSVTEFHFNVHPKSRTPIAFIHQFFILLVRGWTLKKVVCQSAGYLSFLPALFSKVMPFKCYIIAIGTDASRLVEINYGHFTKPLLNKAAYFRKGLDLIFKVAQSFPKSTFTVVSEFTPLDEVPKNVNLIKTVQQAELVKIY